MTDQDLLSSGVNDEMLLTGVNGEDDQDQDDSQDQDQPAGWEEWNDQQKVDWKQKFHATVTSQKREIQQLRNELNQIQKAKTNDLNDEDLAKLREKYDEEDLWVIKKLIQKEANDLIEHKSTTDLAQRELNIFIKNNPEVSEPELRHMRSLQKEYWYSLNKAYRIVTGNVAKSDIRSPNTSIWWSFNWDGSSVSKSDNKSKSETDKAYDDMQKFYGA